jgi:hypothetical protein
LPALLLGAALLFAQWLLVQHEVQVELHAADHACEWCLTHAPLGGGPVATFAAPPRFAWVSIALVSDRVSPLAGIARSAHRSRAPPLVLPA